MSPPDRAANSAKERPALATAASRGHSDTYLVRCWVRGGAAGWIGSMSAGSSSAEGTGVNEADRMMPRSATGMRGDWPRRKINSSRRATAAAATRCDGAGTNGKARVV